MSARLKTMRINKYLAQCGVASRRGAEEAVKAGRVKVNGKVVTELATDIDTQNDAVSVDGVRVKLPSDYTYIMLNKPKGCVCTASDEKDRRTVFDFVDIDKRLFTVGRLDFDSEGLLLFTNNGELAQKLTHPSYEVSKTYIVKVEGEMLESELAVLRKGVTLDDGTKAANCKVKVKSEDTKTENAERTERGIRRIVPVERKFTRLEMVIHEGKNREIRRMFEAIGKTVVFLKRVAIGDLRLGGLSRGEYRYLTEEEVAYLKSLA